MFVRSGYPQVVLRKSRHLPFGITALPEHGELLSLVGGVERSRLLRRQTVQNLTAALAFLARHDFQIHLYHARARTFRISKYVQLTHRQLSDERQIVCKTLLCLAPNAYHAIHSDERVRQPLPDIRHALGEQFAGVVPFHYL